MNYRDPKLRDLLAGEYAMGLLPSRARARFERLMADDDELARLVADWQERLAPIDGTAPPVAPPRRAWRSIEQGTLQRSFSATPPAGCFSANDWVANRSARLRRGSVFSTWVASSGSPSDRAGIQ